MEIYKIISGELDNNTFVVVNGDSAVIVDGAALPEEISPMLYEKKVEGILLTHGHYDHFANLDKLMETFDCPCYLHKNAIEKFGSVELNASYFSDKTLTMKLSKEKLVPVIDGQKLNLIGKEFEVLELPGHTNCGLGFVVDNKIFSGDTLFKAGYGRTDLATSSWREVLESIRKIRTKCKGYELYSGHGEDGVVR